MLTHMYFFLFPVFIYSFRLFNTVTLKIIAPGNYLGNHVIHVNYGVPIGFIIIIITAALLIILLIIII